MRRTTNRATNHRKLSQAQVIALEKFAQAGGHGFGEYSYLSRPTAMALWRRGFIRVGTAGTSRDRHSVGIITEAGLAAMNAQTTFTRSPEHSSIAHLPFQWVEWPVWTDAVR